MEESAKDVTQRILDRHIIYGASNYTNPAYSVSNRSLNYAEGGSITRPENEKVTIIPFALKYSDAVGLFGKENHFIKVNINIDKSVAFACFEEEGWRCAQVDYTAYPAVNTYQSGVVDSQKDEYTVNGYDPANTKENSLTSKPDAYVSVDLNNLKTGNKYIDAWFDVRLYTKTREEHPYDKMYVRMNDFFYIGFHARNTRRLPYNVNCIIGQEYISGLTAEQYPYVNRF
jgi:hypothetical protein